MKRIFRIARPVCLVLAVYVFMISGPQQAAFAALVGTENVPPWSAPKTFWKPPTSNPPATGSAS